MKKLILLTVLISNAYAFECTKYETQIIGKGEIVSTEYGKCLAKIVKVDDYKPSIVCPILLDEVKNNLVSLNGSQCEEVISNENISGVIVSDENSDFLLLEN